MSLDPSRLSAVRVGDLPREYPTFGQALQARGEVTSWSLDELQQLYRDLERIQEDAQRRLQRVQETHTYLQDVLAGRIAPSAFAADDDFAGADDETARYGRGRASVHGKRKVDEDETIVIDDAKRIKSEDGDGPRVIKLSLKIEPPNASTASSAASSPAPTSSHFAGKGTDNKKQAAQQQAQSNRRRRSSKAAASSRALSTDDVDGAAADAAGGSTSTPSTSSANASSSTAAAPSAQASASSAQLDDTPAGGRGGAKSQSVPFETFKAFIEPYVRPFTEAELELLESAEDPDPFPYLIPPLGRSYLDVWAEEAGEAPSPSKSSLSEGETGGAPALGPLSERVLALLIREGLVTATTPGDAMLGDSPEDEPTVQPTAAKAAQAFAHPDQLESRIRRELVYVGLLDDFDDPATVSSSAYATATAAARAKSPSASSSLSSASASASASTLAGSSAANGASSSSASNSTAQAESDEICMQMRVLQGLLRQQIVLNNARKARLYGRVRAQLAFQEYESVMNELNQQIEAGYLKRQKIIQPHKGKGKRKLGGGAVVRTRPPLPDDLKQLLNRAERLPKLLGTLFSRDSFAPPTASVYQGDEAASNPSMTAALAATPFPSRIVAEMAGTLPQSSAPSGRG